MNFLLAYAIGIVLTAIAFSVWASKEVVRGHMRTVIFCCLLWPVTWVLLLALRVKEIGK